MQEDFKRIEGLVKKAGFVMVNGSLTWSGDLKACFLKFRQYAIEDYKEQLFKEYACKGNNQMEINFNESDSKS